MNHSGLINAVPCRFLKAKNSFGMVESGENWHGIDDPGTTFWCIKSSGPVGPDGGVVSSKLCVAGRKCFTKKQ